MCFITGPYRKEEFDAKNPSLMASINFNPFEGWFSKPPKALAPINLLSLTKHFSFPASSTPSKFASLSSSTAATPKNNDLSPDPEPEEPKGPMSEMLDQFFWESENLPDYRHTPEVEAILTRDPVFEKKEKPTDEEIEENEKFWKAMKESPVMNFLLRAEEIYDSVNEMALKDNDTPYRKEDRDMWRKVPHVIGPDGRPMPRKAIKTKKESDDKFWDFARQFFFGLWGFRQRPYPSGRPIDVAQAIGYKRLEQRYYDCQYSLSLVV